MASFNLPLLLALIPIHLFATVTATATATATVSGSDIHDILPEFGLPIGILPDAVESYTLSPTDGAFTVQLTRPCYVQFDDQTVYYSNSIEGKLTYGSVSDVSGIQAKQFFLWLSVTGMDLDTSSGMIEFHVGFLSKKLPADMFQEVPECKSKASQLESYSQSI
ncbi:hypothetical protein L1987_60878 [Smallanthus sonchifolius]|uniref:Uncharacterized protein n=1 Tax=Smallanthus sonchifolius TaxID=185202 RepID=A0ACB9D9N1_9ASTR|nr:hypothetical protein L1987_60878 [Smallanthus sonchifolius]